ncbi:calcium/sodium antiporter [Magnetospira thiophila]
MSLALVAIVFGLALLVWSADRFVEGAAAVARNFGVPPLLIGMVIVGFGTSAPEMMVSALAAAQGDSGLALGNAYGSNIANIALILGLTALMSPILVNSQVLKSELPILALVTGFAAWQAWDGEVGRFDAVGLMALFAGLMGWTVWVGLRRKREPMGKQMAQELDAHEMPVGRAVLWLTVGLLTLLASSQLLVWGAVELAKGLGVSDLIIGLTVVAVGTSLPELASSLMAARKGQHDIALGNVLGSNLFNTLMVVGIAAAIHPIAVVPEVLTRDIPVMALLTGSLFVLGFSLRRARRITRLEGGLLLVSYVAYMVLLVHAVLNP